MDALSVRFALFVAVVFVCGYGPASLFADTLAPSGYKWHWGNNAAYFWTAEAAVSALNASPVHTVGTCRGTGANLTCDDQYACGTSVCVNVDILTLVAGTAPGAPPATCPAAGTRANPVGWSQTGFGSENIGVPLQQIGGCEVSVGPMSCNGGMCFANPTYTGAAGTSAEPTIVPSFSGPPAGGSCSGASHVDFVSGMSICVPDTTAPGDEPCGSGMVRGTVNGTSMCLPGAGPSGTSSSSGTVTKTNADGSTTTTTITNSCTAAGSCTTTTTTGGTGVPSSGGAPGSGAPLPSVVSKATADKPTFCQANPSDVACVPKGDSAAFGDCLSPPSCDGDAILCAIAAQTFQHKCLQVAETKSMHDDARTTRGQAIMDGSDPLGSTLPTIAHAATVNVPSSLDQSGFIGGGSCLQDYTRSVMGRSLTIPFSEVCDGLAFLRYGVLVFCGIISFYIVAGVVRGQGA